MSSYIYLTRNHGTETKLVVQRIFKSPAAIQTNESLVLKTRAVGNRRSNNDKAMSYVAVHTQLLYRCCFCGYQRPEFLKLNFRLFELLLGFQKILCTTSFVPVPWFRVRYIYEDMNSFIEVSILSFFTREAQCTKTFWTFLSGVQCFSLE